MKVRAVHGLSASVARRVVEVARGYHASATLVTYDGRGRGHRANGRSMLELLLLGAGRGDVVKLRCSGADAKAASDAIAAVLASESEEVEP